MSLYIILPYMNPTPTANRLLKHTNPQLYIGKTEVRSSILCNAGPYWGPKIHPVGPSLTHFNVAKQAFAATKRSTGRSYVLQCLALRFHCTHYAQIMESSFSHCKTNNSWWSYPCFGTENLSPCGPKLHLERHMLVCICYAEP